MQESYKLIKGIDNSTLTRMLVLKVTSNSSLSPLCRFFLPALVAVTSNQHKKFDHDDIVLFMLIINSSN